jgi:hypothetical protein
MLFRSSLLHNKISSILKQLYSYIISFWLENELSFFRDLKKKKQIYRAKSNIFFFNFLEKK